MSKQVSFRDTVVSQVGEFLLGVNFNVAGSCLQILKNELVEVANQLSDYYEEGTHLFPEVILLDDLDQFVKEYPCIYNIFYTGYIADKELQRAIKMCAPLANNGWNIFIEVREDKIRWGVVNLELTAVATPIYNKIKDDKEKNYQLVYIKNIGLKTVEFVSRGCENIYKISLSLKNIEDILRDEVSNFCDVIVGDLDGDKSGSKGIIEKTINTAIQQGHGNLIVVIKDEDEATAIPEILKNGAKITPIDFPVLYHDFCYGRKNLESHTCLEKYIDLVVSMLNHDGITVFTTKGKVIGFHFIVENDTRTTEEQEGGSRHKAYHKLCTSDQILKVLMRTQEGVTKSNLL